MNTKSTNIGGMEAGVDVLDLLSRMAIRKCVCDSCVHAPHAKEAGEARAIVAELIEAANALSVAAQITGGVAGPDPNLQAAIERYSQALAKVAQQ